MMLAIKNLFSALAVQKHKFPESVTHQPACGYASKLRQNHLVKVEACVLTGKSRPGGCLAVHI